MSSSWTTAKLSEVCDFYNGLWKGEKPPFVTAGVIRNTNFAPDGTLDDSDIAFLEVEERKLEKRRLEFGDIILEKSGGGPKQPVGRVALFDKTDGIFSFSNFTSALRVRDPSKLDFRFLHKVLYLTHLSGKTEAIQSHSTGIRNLDSDAYKAIEIPIPPLPEQKRIVAILDQAVEAIEKAKANVETKILNTKELLANYLDNVYLELSREEAMTTLGSVVDFRNGLNYTKDSKGEAVEVVGVKDFKDRFFVLLKDLQTIRLDGRLAEGDRLRDGDLLVVRSNGNVELIGRSILAKGIGDRKLSHSGFTIRLRCKTDRLNSAFLCHFLKAGRTRKGLVAGGTGTNIKSLNQGMLSALSVPCPGILRQCQVVKEIDELSSESERLRALYHRQELALVQLKASTLSEALNGKL